MLSNSVIFWAVISASIFTCSTTAVAEEATAEEKKVIAEIRTLNEQLVKNDVTGGSAAAWAKPGGRPSTDSSTTAPIAPRRAASATNV